MATVRSRRARKRHLTFDTEHLSERLYGLWRTGSCGLMVTAAHEALGHETRLCESIDSIELRFYRRERRRLQVALLVGHIRPATVLDHQPARSNQACDFGIAEFVEQAPYIAINRL